MKLFTLYRYLSDSYCTHGIMQVEGIYACDTLELPWRNNEKDVSCIPLGTYTIEREFSRNNGEYRIGVRDVPDRSAIQIHVGNQVGEIEGCILVGTKSINRVLESRNALHKLLELLGDEKAILEIVRL